MVCSASRLSELQRLVLEDFFRRERGFFLSGGGALVGYHLCHRFTSDLDLFTTEVGALERGRRVVRDVAIALGAELQVLQESPTFSRLALARAADTLLVDLVVDSVPQLSASKQSYNGIIVDPPEEIFANKLTALVGRQEERDLIDVYCLEREGGLRVEDFLEAALAKDGGCTPATLAWLLSSFPLPAAERLPDSVTLEDLGDWRDELCSRLRRRAHPGSR
jgi:predicted nucleotidyltransferase component of viral defense system